MDTNRTSQASYPAADDGSCSTSTTPTTATHTYDSADRITDTGYSYDAFGRTTAVPAGSTANGAAVTVGYYAGDLVRTITQASTTKTFTLDPLGRIRQTTSSAGTQTNHYTGGSDSPAWINEANGTWTRNVTAFTGLSATQTSGGTLALQLTNLHGDVIATCADSSSATGVDSYAEQTEYGLDRTVNTSDRYEWLGGAQRASDTVADIVLMGVRLYNPAVGRFLQIDPVVGGSANAYEYCNADPINCRDLDGNFSYVLNLYVGYRPLVRNSYAMSWVRDHFGKVFPFPGCGPTLDLHEICKLNVPLVPGRAPVKVISITTTSWTFEALKGHFDPTGSKITFSFRHDSGGECTYTFTDGGQTRGQGSVDRGRVLVSVDDR